MLVKHFMNRDVGGYVWQKLIYKNHKTYVS